MLDVIYIALMVFLVVVAWAFIVACDHILGPDQAALRVAPREEPDAARPARRRAA